VILNRDTRHRGLLGVAGLFGVFALALTAAIMANAAPAEYDVPVIRAVQDHSSLSALSTVVNNAGTFWFVPFLLATVLLLAGLRCCAKGIPGWACRSEALAAFGIALALLPLNALTKVIVESPRPNAALGVFVDHARHSYGFPSGHVYNDVLFYGVLAIYAPYWAGRRLAMVVRTAALAVIFLAGWGRMVVGAHWPSDVLGGYLWGIAALSLVVALATLIGRRYHPAPVSL